MNFPEEYQYEYEIEVKKINTHLRSTRINESTSEESFQDLKTEIKNLIKYNSEYIRRLNSTLEATKRDEEINSEPFSENFRLNKIQVLQNMIEEKRNMNIILRDKLK